MKIEKIKIDNIPSLIWGEKRKKVFIAVHGNMSNKEDDVIKIFANVVTKKGYQLLSFDLPEHGERKKDVDYLCNVRNCVSDLKKIMEYAKKNYSEINLWACSMGAYFSLLAYKDETINKCLFLSPVVNMELVIKDMMMYSNISEDELESEKEIKTSFGQTLYWDYYSYVKSNKITTWNKETYILYGNKDEIQKESIIKDFSNYFRCKLCILENGEHYFHTKEQLSYYEAWLNNIIA